MSGHLPVDKTFKLFIGGAFPRSESGHTFQVRTDDGRLLANAAKASRKDLREAVRAARSAQAGWAGRTAYNRGQVLYRVAEMLDARSDEFTALLRDSGLSDESARAEVEQARRLLPSDSYFSTASMLLGPSSSVSTPLRICGRMTARS